MDKMLYIATSGAKQSMDALAVRANNLANANTTGFKADLVQARSMNAFGEGLPTRVFAMSENPIQNFNQGALVKTTRTLDIAAAQDTWLSVLDKNGNEAYSKFGSLHIDEEGRLHDASGQPILSAAGDEIEIAVPFEKIEISKDGFISILEQGAPLEAIEIVSKLKLVKPQNLQEFFKSDDGLFRTANNTPLEDEATGRVYSGFLEKSNVNPIVELTDMIELQRRFELQLKLVKEAQTIDEMSTSLFKL